MRPTRRATRLRLAALTAICALASLCAPGVAQAAPTYVSLTFDDATADQLQALPMLSAHGLDATFYVNSARIGSSAFYMTWSQLDEVAAAGNEVGGHSLDHQDLTTLSPAAQLSAICAARQPLPPRGHA